MSEPVDRRKRATYQDVLDAPPHKVAEIVAGELRLSPRPGAPHAIVSTTLTGELVPPFNNGRGGPGGWTILDEPELHLGDELLVPNLAGWRVERLPFVADIPFFTLAPDWICEVLSKSTEKADRIEKMPIYASAGVGFAWLVQPRLRTLEAFRLHEGKWLAIGVFKDGDRARVEPFDAIELDLSVLWAKVPLPTRASEASGYFEYEGP